MNGNAELLPATRLETPLPAIAPAKERRHYSLEELERMATWVAKSGLMKTPDASKVMTLMLLCDADGMHPVRAMRRYHIMDDGQATMRADAMQAEFQQSGGRIEWGQSNREICEATFYHATHAPNGVKLVLTLKEYMDSGIAKDRQGNLKRNWFQNPDSMLRARMVSKGVRMVLPGIIAGIYTPEEVMDFEPPAAKGQAAPPAAPPMDLAEPAVYAAIKEAIDRLGQTRHKDAANAIAKTALKTEKVKNIRSLPKAAASQLLADLHGLCSLDGGTPATPPAGETTPVSEAPAPVAETPAAAEDTEPVPEETPPVRYFAKEWLLTVAQIDDLASWDAPWKDWVGHLRQWTDRDASEAAQITEAFLNRRVDIWTSFQHTHGFSAYFTPAIKDLIGTAGYSRIAKRADERAKQLARTR